MKIKDILHFFYDSRNIGFHKRKTVLGLRFLVPYYDRVTETQLIVSGALACYRAHTEVFPQFKGIYQGRDVVIVATGPTLKDYVPIPNAVHIGVNAAVLYEPVKLDYEFVLDASGASSFLDAADTYRPGACTKFYGVMPYRYQEHTSAISQTHAERANAYRYYTVRDRFNADIATQELGDFGSVAHQAAQFALWTHPRRLYLVGCDCSSGYWNQEKAGNKAGHMVRGWVAFKRFATTYYPDVEIISINPVGLKGVFRDEYHR